MEHIWYFIVFKKHIFKNYLKTKCSRYNLKWIKQNIQLHVAQLWVDYVFLYIDMFLSNIKYIPLDGDFMGDFYFCFLVFACSWTSGDNCLVQSEWMFTSLGLSPFKNWNWGLAPLNYIQNVLKCNTSDSVSRKMSYTIFITRTGKLELN